jgi:hypothetical protein
VSIREIEKRLANARQRLERAIKALAPRHKGGEVEECRAADQEVLGLERELAAARDEEHAVPLDFPIRWDIGAPLPHLLRSDYKCLLIFYVAEPNPTWDGTTIKIVDPASEEIQLLALVEFESCRSAKLGVPNDEVFAGHSLYGRGLDGYSAQRVVNSRWLAELEAVNSVHSRYDPTVWRKANHYIFWFHDSTFECVANSFKVGLYRESMGSMLARANARLLE